MTSIKKNIGYQTIYEVLNTCLPLITAPYLARVLGAAQIGVFSFTQSIANYFVLFGLLGVKIYGTRVIASVRDSKKKCNEVFGQVYSLQLVSSIISLIFYTVYCFLICKDNELIAYIQILAVLECAFNINWVFSGLEKFKLTVVRSIIVRITTVVCILLFVKKPEDLWIYTLLMVGGSLAGILILWRYIPKLIGPVHLSFNGITQHIKPNILLFLPLMAMSIYHLMDKTMLGYLSTYEQTGFYYNADKVINIPIGIIIGIGTVMLPRITNMLSNGQNDKAKALFFDSIDAVSAASIAMCAGIVAIIYEFVPFFFGNGYDACILLTSVLAPVLYIKAISLTIRNEYLIPKKKDKIYILSVVAGAVVNLVVNIIMIPAYGALGAVIGTLTAEFIACIWQIIAIHKSINVTKKLLTGIPYWE